MKVRQIKLKKLINEIITMIENQMKVPDRTYLLKLEDFDTPVIYMEICKHFSSKSELKFIANLEYNKYTYFKDKNEQQWIPALEYLSNNGYAKNEPLTFFRNQAASFNTGKTLFLLMGAETALDRGSLKDFSHISMNDIVERLKTDYSIWFTELLNDFYSDFDKSCTCINNIYKDLFRHINIDAMQLSYFVDDLDNHDIDVWGFYAIYYGENKKNYISNIELIPEENDSNADVSEQSNIILHHIMNYVRTFPSRIDGLNVAFISPTEIQYVVEGINKVTTELEKKKVHATIHLKVICFGGSKNVSGYLKYWLNNYMNKERIVTLKTYLQYISRDKFENELPELLHNQDICFVYDILQTETVQFDQYHASDKQELEYQVNCQFPMTFIPDTISSSHDCRRKVNISQLQFIVSKAYTQLTNKVMQPHAVDSQYKVMQVLELQNKQNNLLKIAHDNCRWVVCEDRAIDKELLNADDNRRIIGFTTGEGCFGEYNVTVSARYDLLEDIKKMLKQRLVGKFTNWSMTRAEASAEYCVNLTESFDGSRILKALNPYDYEIHNFLAYALTVKILGIDQPDNGKYVLRSLINLDNYQHWFKNNETRPDFMLIEIPNNANTAKSDKPLDISIKIIECKMSINVEGYYDEAFGQVSDALSSFSQHWNEHNNGIDRRYWFTQLYRAIVFSKLSLDDNDPKYTIINSKIYNILSGEFNISW